ncbi:hypothetical protein HanIR_Chr11g0556931 [Helianthus annuus]|nr:hypothetical protein HanIR_Chr11g0556931 [Helianthus annuus]
MCRAKGYAIERSILPVKLITDGFMDGIFVTHATLTLRIMFNRINRSNKI